MGTPAQRRRRYVASACLAAYGVLATAYSGRPGRGERALFGRVNAGRECRWLRAPQQWGTPWLLPAVGVAAAGRRRWRTAVTALACLPVEKAVEIVTKKWGRRPRPSLVQPTVLRDDAPVEGPSMPSGHAAIAACGAVLLQPLVPLPVAGLAAATAALTGYVRVRQGAHHPADVVAGWLLGTGLALAMTEVTDGWWPRGAS